MALVIRRVLGIRWICVRASLSFRFAARQSKAKQGMKGSRSGEADANRKIRRRRWILDGRVDGHGGSGRCRVCLRSIQRDDGARAGQLVVHGHGECSGTNDDDDDEQFICWLDVLGVAA